MNLPLYQEPVVEFFYIKSAVDDQHHHDHGGSQYDRGECGQRQARAVGCGGQMPGGDQRRDEGVCDQHSEDKSEYQENIDPKQLKPDMYVVPVGTGQ